MTLEITNEVFRKYQMRTTEKKKEELERDIHIKREREEQEKKKIEASTVLD